MGSGRTEILETLFGIRKKQGGEVIVEGKPVHVNSVSEAIRSGFALIPEDRRKQGLVLMHTVKDNAVLPILKKMVYRHTPIVNDKAADQMTKDNIDQLNIVTSGIKKTISELSGGNQQKVVLAKWLNMKPRIIADGRRRHRCEIRNHRHYPQICRRRKRRFVRFFRAHRVNGGLRPHHHPV